MASIRKSFSFRNGVQVDEDNFIVNANGLVGIGTSVPSEFLDVRGTAKVVGLVTASDVFVSGVATITDIKVGTAISITGGGVGINNDLHVGGDITAFSSSDINLKENINVIPNALDKVNAISGNTFTWKSGKGDDTGVIAQEIEALGLPGVTETRDDGTKAVRYEKLVPVLIQAIKELSAKVDALS